MPFGHCLALRCVITGEVEPYTTTELANFLYLDTLALTVSFCNLLITWSVFPYPLASNRHVLKKRQVHADASNFTSGVSKADAYNQVLESMRGLVEDQRNWVCNTANAASLLWHMFHALPTPSSSVNWSGFYVVDKKKPEQLILGPFHGKVACQTISIGKGVCGTVASRGETLLLDDVETFPGHIACDSDSKSEVVVPINVDGQVRNQVVCPRCLSLTVIRSSVSLTLTAPTKRASMKQIEMVLKLLRSSSLNRVIGKLFSTFSCSSQVGYHFVLYLAFTRAPIHRHAIMFALRACQISAHANSSIHRPVSIWKLRRVLRTGSALYFVDTLHLTSESPCCL